VSIAQYLKYYDSMWKDLMEQQHEYPLQEYAQRSVLTTWKISYEQVKRQSEEASNLLQLWSFLYAGDLWYELVTCIKRPGAQSIVPNWLGALAQNRLKFDRALAFLVKYSLVEGKTETASYAMHSVLHSWCRYLGRSESERDSFRELAIEIMGWMVPSKSMEEYWILQRRLLPHGQAILSGMKLKTKAGMNVNVTWAYGRLAGMFADQDRYVESEEIYERALAEYEEAHGPDHMSTLSIANDLGRVYRDQDRLAEAEAMYRRALAGTEKALGPEHTSTLDIVHNLGLLYADQGKLAEAEAMYERALAGREKVLGPKHTSTLRTVNNLGILYGGQGRLAEAEAIYERALAGYEKALGPEHTSTLNTVNNLGLLYADQGRLAEAEAMYERALAGTERTLGPEHTSTLRTVNNLGLLYADQGRLAEAEAMYERALAGYEKALGPEHTSTLDTVNNLGLLYADQGRLAEAEEIFERALAGSERALGPEHMSTTRLAQRLSTLRIILTESTCADEVADSKTTVSECSNPRHSHDATLLSFPSTIPKLMSEIEEKKHRLRKRDAVFKKLGLRQTAPGTQ
jgi:tetratricopeptide (TPR) repeat protein